MGRSQAESSSTKRATSCGESVSWAMMAARQAAEAAMRELHALLQAYAEELARKHLG